MSVSAAEARENLARALRARLEGTSGAEWFVGLSGSPSDDEARAALAEAPRRVGRKALVGSFAERAGAEVAGVWGAVPVGEWRVDEAARVWIAAAAAEQQDAPYRALFALYDSGDTETRAATLRALNFVRPGDAAEGLELVADAGRTYLPSLLGAAWRHNPFSAEHLSDHDYRKAVLKAFFCDVPVEGFLRLEERADAELAESLCDYIDERQAAGRSVPRALWPIAAMHPRPGLVARLIGLLEHPDRAERLVAAKALRNSRDARAASFVGERLERESDDEVRAALASAREVLG